MKQDEESMRERLRLTFAMFRFGVEMMRQNLRRANPDASEEEIEALLREWLHTRPGAEHGDAVGRPRPLPEWAR